jgi:hypothetical protein
LSDRFSALCLSRLVSRGSSSSSNYHYTLQCLVFVVMNIDTFPPQSTITSKPLVPVPAQFLPRHDVLDQNEPQPRLRYQDHYSPDAYFPPADSLWSFSERSSSVQELQNPNGISNASQVWGTAVVTEIAQPQTPSMTMPAYPTPFFFQPPLSPRAPPTIYGRMASAATRQRTIQACTYCRERKTKVSYFSADFCTHLGVMTQCCSCSALASVQHVSAAALAASSAITQTCRPEIRDSETCLESVIVAATPRRALLKLPTPSTRLL